MTTISESVTIAAPAGAAYDRWTEYEELPRFADGVLNVERRGEDVTHWTVSVAGVTREFDARVLERVPGRRLAWRSITGPAHTGAMDFEPLDETTTRVTARMELNPDGFVEAAADRLGVINLRVRRDLQEFKRYMEDEVAAPPGAWDEPRLLLPEGETPSPPSDSPSGRGHADWAPSAPLSPRMSH